jgi:adenylyltransferase/sulfurtransferase
MENRFKNQERIIDENILAKTRFVIVGAGAIGSAVVLALSKMGMRRATVYDFDTLESHNFANQLHPISQLGKPKVDSLLAVARDYGDCTITPINAPWTPGNAVDADVVISCVDNMDVRKALFDYYSGGRCKFFIDGRMSAFVFKVFGINCNDALSREPHYYRSTLHSQSNASPEPCGEKSIIYTVLLVAGMMCSQVREWLTPEAKPYRNTAIVYDALNHTITKVNHQEPVKMNIVEEETSETDPISEEQAVAN